jgi:ABC-type Fe3+/spermidine/putrescine transport system ATPase subunit
VTALYGHSGSGKTTCLRCIAGLERAGSRIRPDQRRSLAGQRKGIFVPPHKRALGYVFQEASLFPHLSVLANLQFGLKRIAKSTAPGRYGAGHRTAGHRSPCLIAIRNICQAVNASESGSPVRC